MVTSSEPQTLATLPEIIDGLPNICGSESLVDAVVKNDRPVFLPTSNINIQDVKATFAIALHMQQPIIPAGEVMAN